MDSPNHVGGGNESSEYVFDIDLSGFTAAQIIQRIAFTRPIGFEELVKAITQGDKSLARQILRLWGIWHPNP